MDPFQQFMRGTAPQNPAQAAPPVTPFDQFIAAPAPQPKQQATQAAAPVDDGLKYMGGESINFRMLDDIVRATASGASFGFADKIAAFANSSIGSGDYASNLASETARSRQFEQENPALSIGAQLGGALLTGIPGAQRIMAMNAPKVVKTGLIGGGSGGLSGAGHSQGDLGENIQDISKGALAGAALGAAFPLAGDALTRGAKLAYAPVQAALDRLGTGPYTAAQRKLAEAFQRDKIDPSSAMERLSLLGEEAALVDVGGRNTRNLAESIASMPGKGAQTAEQFLENRMLSQTPRIKAAIEDATGGQPGYYEAVESLMANRAQAAAPLYAKAFNSGPVYSDRLQEFLDSPELKEGIRKGLTIQRREALASGNKFNPSDYAITKFNEAGDPIIEGVPNMRLLDAGKRGLDDMLESYRDKTTGKLVLDEAGRALNQVRKSYISTLDSLNKDYKAARMAWSGPSQALDAMALGRKALSPDPEITTKTISNLSKTDREFFLAGVQRALVDKIEAAPDKADAARRIFASKSMRDKIAAAFDDPEKFSTFAKKMEAEAVFSASRNEVLKGSQTARRLAGQEDIGFDPAPLVEAAKGNYGQALMGTLRTGYNALMSPPAAQREELAMMLFDPTLRKLYLNEISKKGSISRLSIPQLQNLGDKSALSAALIGGQQIGSTTSPYSSGRQP